MTKHLSLEKIEQLEKHQLKGEIFAENLLHLNSCLECRQKLKVPSKEEVLKKIFDEEEDQDINDSDKFKKIENSNKKDWFERIKRIFKKKG